MRKRALVLVLVLCLTAILIGLPGFGQSVAAADVGQEGVTSFDALSVSTAPTEFMISEEQTTSSTTRMVTDRSETVQTSPYFEFTIPEDTVSYEVFSATGNSAAATEQKSENESVCALTVRFVYEKDGSMASPAHNSIYSVGESYRVDVPQIAGHAAMIDGQAAPDAISGRIYADTSITVTYVSNGVAYTVRHIVELPDGSFDTYEQSVVGKLGEKTSATAMAEYTVGRSCYIPTPVIITADTVVDIYYYLNNVTVTFAVNGGSNIAKRVVKYGSVINIGELTEPVKAGAVFAGWYIDDKLLLPAEDSMTLTSNITLYAKWNSGTAKYLVVYWLQNADNDGYTLADAQLAFGSVGADAEYSADRSYENYHVNQVKTDESAVTIAGDGSAIRNVYFDRDTYTLTFCLANNPLVVIGKTYTFKAGQSTASAEQWSMNGYRWAIQSLNGGSEPCSQPAVMPACDLTVYGTANREEYKYVTYYYEYDNGRTNTEITEPFVQYLDAANISAEERNAIRINGYEFVEWKSKNPEKLINTDADCLDYPYIYVWKLYYARVTYDIIFRTGSQYGEVDIKTVQGVKYRSDISEYRQVIPNANDVQGISSPVEFEGWYTHPSCVEASRFSFDGAVMPACDLYLYARWIPAKVTVAYETNGGSEISPQIIAAGEVPPIPDDPVREGYSFDGWYSDEGLTTVHDMSSPVTESCTLYAKWVPIIDVRYTVIHRDADKAVFLTETYGGKVGQNITVEALTFDAQENKIADRPRVTLTLSGDESQNVIVFTYDTPSNIVYRIKYVCESQLLYQSDILTTDLSQMVIYAQPPKGYIAGTDSVTVFFENETSAQDLSSNVIIFECVLERYKIRYELNGGIMIDGKINPTEYDVAAESFTLCEPVREGYSFVGWTGTGLEGAQKIVTVAKGSVGSRYYEAVWKKRENLSYTVRYVLRGTGVQIADTKTVNDSLFNSQVTESPIAIDGYIPVSEDPLTVLLDEADKEIVFFYDKRTDLSYTVKYMLFDSDIEIAKSVTTEDCTFGESYAATGLNNIAGYTLVDDSGTVAQTLVKHTGAIGTNVQDNVVIFRYRKNITVTLEDKEAVYTGEIIGYDASTAKVDGLMAFDNVQDTCELTLAGGRTDVGKYTDEFKTESFTVMRGGKDVSSQYIITAEHPADLVITQKPVTVITADISKEYDGKALANGENAVTADALAEGHRIDELVYTGSQLYTGCSDNSVDQTTIVIVDSDGKNVTENYEIAFEIGSLEVTAMPFTVDFTAGSAQWVYDGITHSDNSYTVSFNGTDLTEKVSVIDYDGSKRIGYILPTGDVLTAKVIGEILDAGSVDNAVRSYTFVKIDDNGNIIDNGTIASCYTPREKGVTAAKGTLTVTKRPMTIVTGTSTKAYSGTPLVNSSYTTTGLLATEKLTVEIIGSQTEVGSSKNSVASWMVTRPVRDTGDVSARFTSDYEDCSHNYQVTIVEGTLTVSAPDDGSLDDLPGISDDGSLDDLPGISDDGSLDDLPGISDDGSLDDLPGISDNGSLDDLPGISDDGSLDDFPNISDGDYPDSYIGSYGEKAPDTGHDSDSAEAATVIMVVSALLVVIVRSIMRRKITGK